MKRGSALLIVLGLMAFIIVSAVAFSAYMRFSRLPSSYLRRTSSSRLLVKAALAEAIEKVDAAIGNNPYPGVGNGSSRDIGGDYAGRDRNYWQSRVLTGTNGLVGVDTTVSTLTMEGLAYIPPPFVNEVRYYSRRTPTAVWQTMNYDAGRYVFCAVDVSDCFDVNRMIASLPRSSADDARVTLAHCFENPSHNGYTVDPGDWDDFMDNYIDDAGSKVPLVSVADLNLAIWNKKPSGVKSPFCEYLQQANNAKFVSDNTDGSKDVELLRNMAFVTDSVYVPQNRVSKALDLTKDEDQPFHGLSAAETGESQTKNDDTPGDIIALKSKFFTQSDFSERGYALMPPELFQLYDYLDRDSVPVTLALPTVERAPMVTGVSLQGSLKLVVDKTGAAKEYEMDIDPMTQKPKGYYRVTVGTLKIVTDNLSVGAGFVYPFKYSRGSSHTYTPQAVATIALVAENDKRMSLRIPSATAPVVVTKDEWKSLPAKSERAGFGGKDEKVKAVFRMKKDGTALALPTKVTDEDSAVLNDQVFKFEAIDESLSADFPEATVLTGIALDEVHRKGTFRFIEELDANKTVTKEHPVETTLTPVNDALSGVVTMADGVRYVPVVQVWVRVQDENNNVVDLVPACFDDDEEVSMKVKTLVSGQCDRPALRFWGNGEESAGVKKEKAVLDQGESVTAFYPAAYVADDPRFNFAPENLLALDDVKAAEGQGFKKLWLDTQRSSEADRDGDIFMMTSDAGRLQSIFELSALLNVCGFAASRDMPIVNSGYDGARRDSFARCPANEAMWRTYSQFKTGSSAGRDITEAFGDGVSSGDAGFRVNPFTSDVNIFLSALANTPLDWWAASTDEQDNAKKKMVDDLDTAIKYTFSEFGDQAKVKHGTKADSEGTLTQLAQTMMAAFKANAAWTNAFDDLAWDSDNLGEIAGVDLGSKFNTRFHSVDRKYLHGFWRDCFANRQQLFLIFVRAEPMMMGGGGLGQTPPQLGARAVALVWRDPNCPAKNGSSDLPPHRTRVLFYRQFE